jgi:hypothetical protein
MYGGKANPIGFKSDSGALNSNTFGNDNAANGKGALFSDTTAEAGRLRCHARRSPTGGGGGDDISHCVCRLCGFESNADNANRRGRAEMRELDKKLDAFAKLLK